ncbi:Adenylate cyclase [Candidatus Burkholderia verschuerenii]|uniref:Adenylate cyclase n=1 Tax=Candidatus Burkholderia verschuerenii TaxID=242163 RepID=A0A0L0MEU8_9BURK|nr:adenylate/guanylate cyclase domain-containing protein [Candidatus Burkholderia verschuerenii]KND61202.1 Adenylate cyclase [Candidatus Burkholderia verschuerenii]
MDRGTAVEASHLQRVTRTILFADLVESCRLAEADEEGTATRWRGLRMAIETRIVPGHHGRLVRTEGDGLMIVFEEALEAAHCALDIQRMCRRGASAQPGVEPLLLRESLHETDLLADQRDVYGRGVNLAARLYNLAGPGEIVISERIRERLAQNCKDQIEDLGECHLRHLARPVHAYRLGGPGPRPVIAPGAAAHAQPLRASVAVIPFAARAVEPGHEALGEILADEIIAALSRCDRLQVISRLSTSVLRNQRLSARETSALLDARYVLSGAYRTSRDRLILSAELADARSDCVVWAQTMSDSIGAIVLGESDLAAQLRQGVGAAVVAHELDRARTQSLPTLESSMVLLNAIALMHRGVFEEFERAGQMLEVLAERARRQATPYAWLAKWHVLRFNRGWTTDRLGEAQAALDCAKAALDADSQSSIALAVEGFVQTNLLRELDIGEARYSRALEVNPNDSLAWLLKGTLHAFKGEGDEAVAATSYALSLSPLDPLRNFYESLCATAALSAKEYKSAIRLAQASPRGGPTNTSTLRALAIAQSELGLLDDARATVARVLAIEPGLTVKRYLERSPSAGYETGRIWSTALQRAGLPPV